MIGPIMAGMSDPYLGQSVLGNMLGDCPFLLYFVPVWVNHFRKVLGL